MALFATRDDTPLIADVLEDASATAITDESRGDVSDVLVGWGSAAAGLAAE